MGCHTGRVDQNCLRLADCGSWHDLACPPNVGEAARCADARDQESMNRRVRSTVRLGVTARVVVADPWLAA